MYIPFFIFTFQKLENWKKYHKASYDSDILARYFPVQQEAHVPIRAIPVLNKRQSIKNNKICETGNFKKLLCEDINCALFLLNLRWTAIACAVFFSGTTQDFCVLHYFYWPNFPKLCFSLCISIKEFPQCIALVHQDQWVFYIVWNRVKVNSSHDFKKMRRYLSTTEMLCCHMWSNYGLIYK